MPQQQKFQILLILQRSGVYHVFSQGGGQADIIDCVPKNTNSRLLKLEQLLFLIANFPIGPGTKNKILLGSLKDCLLRNLTSSQTLRKYSRSTLKALALRALSVLTKLSELFELFEDTDS